MKYIQNTINNNLNILSKELTKPQKRAIKEISNGIIRQQSCILKKIFIDTKNKKVQKKAENIVNILKKIELTEKVNEFINERATKYIKKDSVIAFDESEIAKPKTKKAEKITRIWDASQKRRCNGYNLCGIASRNSFHQLEIWDKEKETIAEIRWRMISKVAHQTKGKGIFVFDRGHDHTRLIKQLLKQKLRFVIRVKNLRNPRDLADNVVKNVTDFDLGYHPIRIKEKSKPWTGELYLVVTARINSVGEKEKAFFYTNLSPQQYTIKDVRGFYNQRWNIEVHYQQLKTHYGLESIRVKSLQTIKNILALCVFILWLSNRIHLSITKNFNVAMAGITSLYLNFKRFCYRFSLAFSSVSAFRSFLAKNTPLFFPKPPLPPPQNSLPFHVFPFSGVF